jgi:hypothetical protein
MTMSASEQSLISTPCAALSGNLAGKPYVTISKELVGRVTRMKITALSLEAKRGWQSAELASSTESFAASKDHHSAARAEEFVPLAQEAT